VVWVGMSFNCGWSHTVYRHAEQCFACCLLMLHLLSHCRCHLRGIPKPASNRDYSATSAPHSHAQAAACCCAEKPD
jgi:hypothetical protein